MNVHVMHVSYFVYRMLLQCIKIIYLYYIIESDADTNAHVWMEFMTIISLSSRSLLSLGFFL